MLKIRRSFLGILMTVCMLVGMAAHLAVPALAADSATFTVSGGSCEVGKSIKVSVKVSAPADIGVVSFTLTYDTDMLECEGKSGTIKEADSDISGKSKTYTYTFKAKKEGTATIKASKVEIYPLYPEAGKEDQAFATKVTDGSVKITPPYVASSNAKLKSLSIDEGKISPSFSKDVYEYTADIDGKHSSVSVSAKADDSKATVSVSGNKKLKEGKNTVEIKVTAEDGKTTKTYKIVVTRGPVPTNTPTNTPTPSPSPSPSATPTPGLMVHVDERDLMLMDAITTELPEGFTAEVTDLNGYRVAVASSENDEAKLVQMSDGKLYVLGTGDNGEIKCDPYRMFSGNVRQYLYLAKPDDVTVPEGFTEGSVAMNDELYSAYRSDADESMYLIFMRSPEGNEGWYLFDVKEQTIQRYSDKMYTVQSSGTPTPTPAEPTPAEPTPAEPTPTKSQDEPGDNKEPTPSQPTPAGPTEPAKQGDNGDVPTRTTRSGGGFWKLIENLSKRERIGAAVICGLVLLCVLLFVLLLIAHNRNAKEIDAEEFDEEEEKKDKKKAKEKEKKPSKDKKEAGREKPADKRGKAAPAAAAVSSKKSVGKRVEDDYDDDYDDDDLDDLDDIDDLDDYDEEDYL